MAQHKKMCSIEKVSSLNLTGSETESALVATLLRGTFRIHKTVQIQSCNIILVLYIEYLKNEKMFNLVPRPFFMMD